MLSNRIVSTLEFFDLQDFPLTGFEVFIFLFPPQELIRPLIGKEHELNLSGPITRPVSLDVVLLELDNLVGLNLIVFLNGFYALPGRQELISKRLQNHTFGVKRERLVSNFKKIFLYIPFVRSIALNGSQAFGQQRPGSDIDLFVVTDPNFLWIARTGLTSALQLFGVRRHGKKISNRFCLNHYIAGPKAIHTGRNLYSALEYLKLRPLTNEYFVATFKNQNPWITAFFPQHPILENYYSHTINKEPLVKVFFEKVLNNNFGKFIEKQLGKLQLGRIRQEKHILVAHDELSFHPDSKQENLLARFYKF